MATYTAYQVIALPGLLEIDLNTGTTGRAVTDKEGLFETDGDLGVLGNISDDNFDANTGLLGLAEDFTYAGVVTDSDGNAVGFIGQQIGGLAYKVFVPDGTDVSGGLQITLLGGVPNTLDIPWDIDAGAPVCFLVGTSILTPNGEVKIENLQAGDMVLTVDGNSKAVRWIGRYTASRMFADPRKVLPIRIMAGAIGENVPSRDLLVSPDHALFVEGNLVHASALVNGRTIVREMNVPEVFTYYHIEVEGHSLVLAENTPSETFVDNVSRMNFDNWEEYAALNIEEEISEMDFPRVKSSRQLPEAVKSLLSRRAGDIEQKAAA